MAIALGKRKRGSINALSARQTASANASSTSDSEAEHVKSVFQRHFEAKFTPLSETEKSKGVLKAASHAVLTGAEDDHADDHDDEEELSSWYGFSDSGNDLEEVEVIRHTSLPKNGRPSRAEVKALVSSVQPVAPNGSDGLSDDEASNLKNDLELQRLLRESHLLASANANKLPAPLSSSIYSPAHSALHTRPTRSMNTASPPSIFPASTPAHSGNHGPRKALKYEGSTRHAARDIAMRSLGAKRSIFEQKNVPMKHRKGIAAKRSAAEKKRRADAQEAGVVLERPGRARPKEVPKREKGVGGPSVGKFRAGMLQLSRSDIRQIRGDSDALSNRSGGRGGRGSDKGGSRGRGGRRRGS